MDVYLFQYCSGQYHFLLRQRHLTLIDTQLMIKGEYVKDVYIFYSRDERISLDLERDVRITVFDLPDYKNLGLNGFLDMDENLKDLFNNKDLKALFSLAESKHQISRSASDTGIYSEASSAATGCFNEKLSAARIKFIFENGYCATEIHQNGVTGRIKNSYGLFSKI
jgi:hypothetical protein